MKINVKPSSTTILIVSKYKKEKLEHSFFLVYDRRICKIYIFFSKNDPHKWIYNCINLQVFYSNYINLYWYYSFYI